MPSRFHSHPQMPVKTHRPDQVLSPASATKDSYCAGGSPSLSKFDFSTSDTLHQRFAGILAARRPSIHRPSDPTRTHPK